MRWTIHLEGGPRRVNHAAVSIKDKIFSFGGYCSTDEYKDWEAIPVHVLNTNTLRWSPVLYRRSEIIPFQRYGHSAVAYGDKVFMWGGRNNAVACDTLSCFDTEKLEWTNPRVSGSFPHAKDGHSACVINNKMYIFGGFEYLSDQYSQEVHCLDLDTMVWTELRPNGIPPGHRDFHTAVAVNERMYIFGGRGDLNSPYNSHEEIYCPHVYYLDIKNNTWVTCNARGTWPEGRRSHSAWLHKDYMYIFGGYNGNTNTHFNDIYRYSIRRNFWEHVKVAGVGPSQRRRHACILYKDKVYIFGGTSPCEIDPSLLNGLNQSVDVPEILMDNSDLHVLDNNPSLRVLSILCVVKHKLEISCLPLHLHFNGVGDHIPKVFEANNLDLKSSNPL